MLSCVGHSEENLSQIVGQSIWASLPDQNPDFFSAFIQGMRESQIPPTKEELFNDYEADQRAKTDLSLKEQLLEADELFSCLQHREDLKEVIPKKVYFQTKKTGSGKELSKISSEVMAFFKIETIEKTHWSFTPNLPENMFLPLSSLMPGLAKGMLGMKEGEERKIFIHPEYSYSGIFSLNGHPALVVEVKLEAISPNSEQVFSIDPISFAVSQVSKEHLEKEYTAAHLKLAYQYGKAVWNHYKWAEPAYTFEDVISHIHKARQGSTIDLYSTPIQNRLVDLHWSLYQKQEKSLESKP